jgi:hypothetical protein
MSAFDRFTSGVRPGTDIQGVGAGDKIGAQATSNISGVDFRFQASLCENVGSIESSFARIL